MIIPSFSVYIYFTDLCNCVLYLQMLMTSMSKHFVRVHKWDDDSAKAWQSITLKRTGLMKVTIKEFSLLISRPTSMKVVT